jgi:hypothetical protein
MTYHNTGLVHVYNQSRRKTWWWGWSWPLKHWCTWTTSCACQPEKILLNSVTVKASRHATQLLVWNHYIKFTTHTRWPVNPVVYQLHLIKRPITIHPLFDERYPFLGSALLNNMEWLLHKLFKNVLFLVYVIYFINYICFSTLNDKR